MTIKKMDKSCNEGYELYEYIFDTQHEQINYPYSDEEELIKFVTTIDKKYCTIVKKWNFISKIRQLTEDNKPKTFSQKHDYLARKIAEAAEHGNNSCRFCLSEEEVEDLRAEGFTVEYNGYREYSTISW